MEVMEVALYSAAVDGCPGMHIIVVRAKKFGQALQREGIRDEISWGAQEPERQFNLT